MKLKSYFSGTVEAAMELARRELGEEALLVNARPSTPETRYLGAYEVVFGTPPRQAAKPSLAQVHASLLRDDFAQNHLAQNRLAQDRSAQAAVAHYGAVQDGSARNRSAQDALAQTRLAEDVAGLKRDVERMMQSFLDARAMGGSQTPSAQPVPGTPIADEPLCEVDSMLGRPGAARAIVALVGPPGAGRTTTLVKLAARYGLTGRKPAQILSADVYRIAAADQLRSLASILGIGCDIAETAGALAQMIEEHRTRELIFIDTPGLARADMEDAADLAELIASHPEIDTHLVLPAFMRASDMARAIDQYCVFGPRKLLFTRIDETDSYADLVREAARHSLPVSFLGTGQQIPDDLEPADKGRLAEWLLEDSPKTLQDSLKSVSAKMRGAAA